MKTKDRIINKEVNIYIIKDGNLIQKKSKFKENSQISTDELCLLKMTSDEEITENIENVYKCLLDNGYTVIRKTNRNCQIFLGYTIKKIDKSLILKIIENSIKNKKVEIYNRVKSSYGREYEVISINNTNVNIVVKILLDEKYNELDEEEKKILNNYRNFDLKKLLIHENNGIINNSNSGVMIITTKELICSTLKKKNCKEQINSILENFYNKEDIDKLNIVTIQIQGNKKIIVDMPERINEFQNKTITDSIKLIKTLKIKEVIFIVNGKEIELNEFEKYLKQKEINNNIKNIKYIKYKKKEKIRKIGNIEIKSILKIKDKKNSIGQRIRHELEEYALKGLILKGNAENKIIGNKIKNAEVAEIISKIEDEYVKKIPLDIMQKLKFSKNGFSYNTRKKLINQDVKDDTIKILSYINLNYWCDKVEKDELEEIYRRNEERDFNNTLNINNNKEIAVIKPQNWLIKLMSSIKRLLGDKQEVYSK